ncbi:MAG: ACT domain-containing protein [Planctomycetota bacterium]|nr:ACT domain-containing protein [Planctomycetota bacterium]
MAPSIQLQVIDGVFAVARLDPWARVPEWALTVSALSSITRTTEELSLVCEQTEQNRSELAEIDPACIEAGWRGIRVTGTLDFALTGILAGLSKTLADADISIFALSTFDTDYILVRDKSLAAACVALRKAGYSFAD